MRGGAEAAAPPRVPRALPTPLTHTHVPQAEAGAWGRRLCVAGRLEEDVWQCSRRCQQEHHIPLLQGGTGEAQA